MRKAAVLLFSVTVLCIFIAAVITQSLVILQRVAMVSDAHGFVWVKQRGHSDFVALADRGQVAAGDVIKTDGRGGVALTWLDGTHMRVGANSVMTVLKCQINTASKAETSLFKLDAGRVWIRVLKVLSHKSKFEVLTPTATAGVRGTVFSVAVTPEGKTLVSVKEGAVALDSAGKQALVQKGQMTVASGGAARVQPLASDEDKLWQRNVDVANPSLTICEPAAETKVAPGQAVTVKGQAEIGASVTVNAQSVPVRLKGLFDATVTAPRQAGEFAVTVQAKDARGYVAAQTVKLQVTK